MLATSSEAAFPGANGKIVFQTYRDGNWEIYSINADGTGQANLTNNAGSDTNPTWSPDGTKIAFDSQRDGGASEVYSMNADGTGQARLTTNTATDNEPVWSPDGTEIAFDTSRDHPFYEIYSMNADGSSPTRLTTNAATDVLPDWQPIISTGYARPKGASPIYSSLVIAYNECPAANANSLHAGSEPVAGPSCRPPVASSPYLTVGEPSAGGGAANMVGAIRLVVTAGDVLIDSTLSDVRCNPATPPSLCGAANTQNGPDYTGEVKDVLKLRITDKNNTPIPGGPGPATVVDKPFSFSVQCVATPGDLTKGSDCNLTGTSANALVPGTFVAGKRANVQLEAVEVFDGGSDGVAGSDPNALFASQGFFVP